MQPEQKPLETGEQLRRPLNRQQQQQQQQSTTDYARVELLHRMLVQQQLQQLEQRRLLRLALARRRLEFGSEFELNN